MQGASMYVFYRLDRDPKLTYLFSSYEETANTKAIEFQGKTVCALFLAKGSARMVALQQGWKEITNEWNKEDENNEDQAQTVVDESQAKSSTTVVEKVIKPKTKRKRTTKSKK
jgi:hypothetical protein